MQRISSNSTLFLKIFIPVLWTVFFGLFTLAIWLTEGSYIGPVRAIWMKLGLAAFLLLGMAFLYFTLWRLRRVEIDELYIYATDYFRTYRYPYHNVEKITERDMGLFHLVRVHLKVPGKFGKKIAFLLDEATFEDYLGKNPQVAERIAEIGMRARKSEV